MRKGISTFISILLLILISTTATYLALNVLKPTVERAYESALINEAEQNMKLLDNLIREVASEGIGSLRSVVVKVSDGSYRIVNTSGNFTGALQFKAELKYSPFAAPMLKKVGNLKYTVGMNAIGLIGYWRFDERNGTMAEDSSGYGNHGTLYNGSSICSNPPLVGAGCPEWVDGKFGRALKFDGIDDYVNSSYVVSVPNSFTALAWWKRSGPAGGVQSSYHTIITGLNGYGEDGNRVLVASNGLSVFAQITNMTGTYFNAPSLSISPAEWNQVGIIFDGSKVYTVANGLISSPTVVIGALANGSKPIVLGKVDVHYIANGTIDEVRIYNRALSEEEIKENYDTKASNYQLVLEYNKIILTGNFRISKGTHKICVEKAGEVNGKPILKITTC
ncbi:MAG: LamG domain-containing protein [Candidatus Aenigmatarchaeota archaeon]